MIQVTRSAGRLVRAIHKLVLFFVASQALFVQQLANRRVGTLIGYCLQVRSTPALSALSLLTTSVMSTAIPFLFIRKSLTARSSLRRFLTRKAMLFSTETAHLKRFPYRRETSPALCSSLPKKRYTISQRCL